MTLSYPTDLQLKLHHDALQKPHEGYSRDDLVLADHSPHLSIVRLRDEISEETVCITQAPLSDDGFVSNEAITPIQAKHVLTSACKVTQRK